MRHPTVRRTAALFALCFSWGCAAKKQLTADEYFSNASKEFRRGSYQVAIENYRELLDQYPFSQQSEEAELKIAHAHYLNHSWPEAIAAFSDFQRRHPTSPYLPLVGFLLGECYENQMYPADRDQSAAQNAHAYYVAVVQQYPESPFADLARDRMEYCRERLAAHEMIIADYYESRENAQAAEYRLLDLVNRFNDTDVAGDALYELGRLYRRQGEDDKAALAFAAVTQHHPKNRVALRAQRALSEIASDGEPSADPLAVLQAQSGRSRVLAMAQTADIPEQTAPKQPGFGPAAGGLPGGGGGGPFGGRY